MRGRGRTFVNRADTLPDPYSVARRRMVSEQLVPGGIRDSRVLEVMGRVKRHAFVSVHQPLRR